jgi:methionyl aminopeptidase
LLCYNFLMIGRNDPCWCGSGEKWKKCHYPHKGPQHSLKEQYLKQWRIHLKNEEQIEGIRRSGRLAAQILDATCDRAKAGITTQELNDFAEKLHKEAGALAAPLGYGSPPFPRSICTSLNEVICHGIPDQKPLVEGDILNIDITCILDGYYGDCSKMVMIGEVGEEKRRVVDVAYECLMRSMAVLKPGAPLCLIGNTIEEYANAHGCSVVNQFVGHGVGLAFHEPPQVPHYANTLAIPLAPGMIFTIEPMINIGVRDAIIDGNDRWTARTMDGKPSAQWEHTFLITETGYEILTPWKP